MKAMEYKTEFRVMKWKISSLQKALLFSITLINIILYYIKYSIYFDSRIKFILLRHCLLNIANFFYEL